MADDEKQKEIISTKEEERSSLSSDEIDEDLPSKELATIHGKSLTFNHGDFPWRDMEILQDGSPVYFVDIAEFTNAPDVTLHRGGKDGQVVGAAHYRFSLSLKCGVGTDEISMRWTEMKRHGAFKTKQYRFHWNGATYTMCRAKSEDYGGTVLSRLLLTHFKIVEDDSGKVVALYVSEVGYGKKKGTLKLAAGIGEDLEVLCVLGVASWRDKIRRNRQRNHGGGGGGGP